MQIDYRFIFYFFIYAILGWGVEVIYTYFKRRTWVNRGFLYGPLCPIYGIGVFAIYTVVGKLMGEMSGRGMFVVFYIFIIVTVLTTLIEWGTGAILEKLFMTKWWDYSTQPFNYKGYVCLLFSLIWGMAGTLLLLYVHPFVVKGVAFIPKELAKTLAVTMLVMFSLDLIYTIKSLVGFRKLLLELEHITSEYVNAKDKLLQEIESIISEIDSPTSRIKTELGKVSTGMEASKDRLKEELSKMSEDLMYVKSKLNTVRESLLRIGRIPNGAIREFLSNKPDIEKRLRAPMRTNIIEVHEHFHKLAKRLSKHRLFKSFPEMQSEKYEAQLEYIKRKYQEAQKRRNKK